MNPGNNNNNNIPSITGSDDGFHHEDIHSRPLGGFTYGLGVSIGILVLITTITVASYFCTRDTPDSSPAQQEQGGAHHHVVVDVEMGEEGLDEATLKSYPKYYYSQLGTTKGRTTTQTQNNNNNTCCSICLGNYKGSDVIRVLHECGHVFHLKCVDPWLRLHPTCPLCRTSPLPTPLSTPLVEIVPLASNMRGG